MGPTHSGRGTLAALSILDTLENKIDPSQIKIERKHVTEDELYEIVANSSKTVLATGSKPRLAPFPGGEHCLSPVEVLNYFQGLSKNLLS